VYSRKIKINSFMGASSSWLELQEHFIEKLCVDLLSFEESIKELKKVVDLV